jgi:hypothetical protein
MTRLAAALALLVICASAAAPGSRRGVWFCGDFETGGLEGWSWDISRRHPAVVVTKPVRKGRYAVRITLAAGDIAAMKERAELKVGDKQIELVRGRQGGEMWYGWSLFLPADYADPPGEQFQILAQWHHRPAPGGRSQVTGPPPLTLHLVSHGKGNVLALFGRASSNAPRRTLGTRPIRRGAWTDLVFHIKWSLGSDGFVEAWLDGRPFTKGKQYGRTLYNPVANYLRLGLYRAKGVPTTNSVYYDEVRIGDSYQAVAP